ncbi:DUF4383 domain-containing protein [Streptomyces sp. NPDC002209]|uniref:DUF4383 domain-containing protein n=1 Tax=Streptomyces sp. NPDC002209 TaxID=3364638 RepID=UPI0036CBD52F
MRLRDELPVDHRLNQVYRVGAALCGLLLLVFGCLGFADSLSSFGTEGQRIAGLATNDLLSAVSVAFGLLLIMSFGMYGRVSGGLPHDNPYWRRRHPEQPVLEAALSRPQVGTAATDTDPTPEC